LIESAHAFLAGLDPADEIDFACHSENSGSLHLQRQNGLKSSTGQTLRQRELCVSLSVKFRALERNGYGKNGETRLLRCASVPAHESRALAGASGQQPAHVPEAGAKGPQVIPRKKPKALIADRNYAALDQLVIEHFAGEMIGEERVWARQVLQSFTTLLPKPDNRRVGNVKLSA